MSDTTGGEVILTPTVGAEFQGTTLPSGWSTGAWNAGGTATVGSGSVVIDGSWIRSNGLVGAGRAIEFVGTFNGATFQNAGFGLDLNGTASESWAMFGVNGTAGTLQARTLTAGGAITDVPLGAQYIGSAHLFRIEWDTAVRFYIDGTLVHTAATVSGTMRPIASDFNTGGGGLTIDWMRMTPYASPGTFTSRVLDAGASANWGTLSYVADASRQAPPSACPFDTGTRRRPTGPGAPSRRSRTAAAVGGNSRYIQYQAAFSTTAPDLTASLSSVSIGYVAGIGQHPSEHQLTDPRVGGHQRQRRHQRDGDVR